MRHPLRIVIVGPGRAGQALSSALRARPRTHVTGIARTAAGARRAARQTRAMQWTTLSPRAVQQADAILICVPDDRARAVAVALRAVASPRAVLLHLSGSLPAVLLPHRRGSADVGSMHPLFSFPAPGRRGPDLAGVWWAVGGAPRARAMARRLARQLGGRSLELPESGRVTWHLAAALSANHLVALLDTAAALAARRLGLRRARAEAMLLALAASVLDNARAAGLRRALTGPIVRGDVETVKRHMAALAREPRPVRDLYRLLGLRQIDLAGRSPRTRKLRRLLEKSRGRH